MTLIPIISSDQQALAIEQSFKAQLADTQLLHPITLRDIILAGVFPLPQRKALAPPPFKGMREELLIKITNMVHQTINHLDYNGLWPHLDILDQLDKGKTFREITLNPPLGEHGSACLGMSYDILQMLKEKHSIEGALAVVRRGHPFVHAAVVIECRDGFVLLDANPNPASRIFSVPFQSTQNHQDFSIFASKPGSAIPITIKYENSDETIYEEYCTDIDNGDDLVMKRFVMATWSKFIPISVYNPDGSPHKYILVVLNQSKIVLKDHFSKEKIILSFESIRNGELLPQLKAFMDPRFHTPLETLYQQIVRLASQEERIKVLFTQSNLDETF